jgi:hypothetical protein
LAIDLSAHRFHKDNSAEEGSANQIHERKTSKTVPKNGFAQQQLNEIHLARHRRLILK